MIQIRITCFETAYHHFSKEYRRNGRSAVKWFHWPTVPGTGDKISFMDAFCVDVVSVYHWMGVEVPYATLECNIGSWQNIKPLIDADWERCGYLEQNFNPPKESLKYNKENPAPDTLSVDSFPISGRLRKIMKKHGIINLGTLVKMSEKELLEIPKIGRSSLHDLRSGLRFIGRSMSSAGM